MDSVDATAILKTRPKAVRSSGRLEQAREAPDPGELDELGREMIHEQHRRPAARPAPLAHGGATTF